MFLDIFLIFQILQIFKLVQSSGEFSKNSIIEYCSEENPGTEKVCRDAQAMKQFSDSQLRIHGAFMTYTASKIFDNIVFGWGQCIPRPNGSYIKLLPWGMWQKKLDVPFIVVISEMIGLFTTYADQQAEIPISEKTHVMILNGELRSFRGDIRRRCVAYTPQLQGVNHYHFSDKNGNDDFFMTNYLLTQKDKIFIGKEEMEECNQYAKMDSQRNIFLKKIQANIIPEKLESCSLSCTHADISIIRAKNGTGLAIQDEEAGLTGLLVMYAMNETEADFNENRVYSPTFNKMLTAMYDTEVALGSYVDTINDKISNITTTEVNTNTFNDNEESSMSPLPATFDSNITGVSNGRSFRRSTLRRPRGRDLSRRRTRPRRNDQWLEEMMDTGSQTEQKRSKRLTYSSAVFMANTLSKPNDGSGGGDELRCVG